MNERGLRLKKRREELGLTTRDLCKMVNVTQSTISNIEAQGSMPKLELAYNLAKALGKSTDWILTGVDDHSNEMKIPITGDTKNGSKAVLNPILGPDVLEFVNFSVDSTKFYALKVVDDSLSPRVLEGEVIIIDPMAEPQTGEDVVIKMKDGCFMIKTLSSIRNEKVFLDSTKHLHQRVVQDLNDIESMHLIIGTARSTFIKNI
ncbi:LexA family transcriptional regulator (plasmid) [Orbus sturtevantii]|uniref:XRE family transcriptional regulator n=1 Tax=Orbus sturtevantii TaxID=3074109 RepID=UPI00370D5A72